MAELLVMLCGALGLCVGSFLNVVVHRLPRGESLVHPRSRCPGCGSGIRAHDNVPVLSWLVLRGRCRSCRVRIPVRYPLVELATGVLFAAMAARFGPSWELPAFLYLAAAGVALAVIDLDVRRLPNAIVLPSYGVGLALLGVAAVGGRDPGSLLSALVGMAALLGLYVVLVLVHPAGMGLGDVKLSGVLGLHLGWLGLGHVVLGAFAGFLLGGIAGVALMLVGRAGRRSAIPFGPAMLLGALVAVLAGGPLVDWYLDLALGRVA